MDTLKLIIEDTTLSTTNSMARAIDMYNTNEFEFRAVTKTKIGMGIVDFRDFENKAFSKDPSQLLAYFKKGVLQTVEAKAKGSDYWMRVFKRKGKKITLIDRHMLYNLTVGTINSAWHDTNLYSWEQYKATNTSSWASYAYRYNEIKQTSTVKA
jgi:hypothetical protein